MEAMRQATQLVRTRGPGAATRFIQGLLRPKQVKPTPASPDIRTADVRLTTRGHARRVLEPLPAHDCMSNRYRSHYRARRANFSVNGFPDKLGAQLQALCSIRLCGTPLPWSSLHGCTQNPDDCGRHAGESVGGKQALPGRLSGTNSTRQLAPVLELVSPC